MASATTGVWRWGRHVGRLDLKRRASVVGILPNPAAVIRLVGAVPDDMQDEWQAGDRRHLTKESMALLKLRWSSRPRAFKP